MKPKNCSFCGKEPAVAEGYGFMPVCLSCKEKVERRERERKESNIITTREETKHETKNTGTRNRSAAFQSD